MKVRILQEGRLLLLLVCSLLWHTVLGADYHDVRLARRQDLETATVTVTVFTQFTVTETATVTVTPTRAVVTTTVVSTERTTATQVRTVTTCVGVRGGGGRRRRRRDDGDDGKPAATTSTTTLWQSPDATKTLTITATDLQSALQVTATRVVTEVEVVTAEQTATSSAETLPIPSPDGSDVNKPDPLAVVKEEEVHGVHLAIVLGAVFGSVVGAIALFVAGFLWMKKREEKILELEEVAGSVPLGGGGGGGRVAGMLIAPLYISSNQLTFLSCRITRVSPGKHPVLALQHHPRRRHVPRRVPPTAAAAAAGGPGPSRLRPALRLDIAAAHPAAAPPRVRARVHSRLARELHRRGIRADADVGALAGG